MNKIYNTLSFLVTYMTDSGPWSWEPLQSYSQPLVSADQVDSSSSGVHTRSSSIIAYTRFNVFNTFV